MKIRDWSEIKFSEDTEIEWPCPNCGRGALKINKDKFHSAETAESKKARDDEFWEDGWHNWVFNGALECYSCRETVTMVGSGYIEHVIYMDQITHEVEELSYKVFVPNFFHPTLHLFQISDNCPKFVKEEIINSFRLFWFDLPSCANKIRTSLELLLNEEKVNKTKKNKNGTIKKLTLNERIVEFRKKNLKLADFLLAIKWIGNEGSHVGKLERNDLLDAYELLDFSLIKLYDDKETTLEKIQKEINKRKGTRKIISRNRK